ncbi:MAG TPA: TonB-dependent receptor [Vicinamibacterales bacterium]|nr:TonB-dependent receptor [Vicinamibacterales bacterium]
MTNRVISAVVLVVCLVAGARAQQPTAIVDVVVRSSEGPIPGAIVRSGTNSSSTDATGTARLVLPPGPAIVTIGAEGFIDAVVDVVLDAGQTRRLPVTLIPLPEMEEEVVVVATTRTGRRVDDQPTRVEVIGREEIEEKMLMTPGDIVMMLNEMGGLRVQATSPSLGAAAVRIQGMRGRYTRFLSDGLPLYGEQPGGIGLLQTPPMDLGQVEVIKGVASALYGAGAMGGVVNLISRRPGDEPEQEMLANVTSRGGADAVLWLSTPLADRGGLTLLASGHGQRQADVDDDGWADVASYSRAVVRPRFFWDDRAGRSVFATVGLTVEERTGGTAGAQVPPQIGDAYREALQTTRFDVGVVGQTILDGRYVLTARAAAATGAHDHVFGEVRERDRHTTAFGEAAVRSSRGRHTWVAGVAVEHDRYVPTGLPGFAYSFTTPGLFVQDDVDVRSWLSISASARFDWHSEYGFFANPRVSALFRRSGWTSRVSFGTGFYGSTYLTEETEAAGLTRLSVPEPLEAERGRSLSFDLGRRMGPFGWNATLFASWIDSALRVDRETVYALRNIDGDTTNGGVELLGTYRRGPVAVTGSYAYVRSRETDGGLTSDVALTPRHSAGLVAMVESEDWGRVGFELYYTGRQSLEADPYRAASEPYAIVGLLVERRFGRFRLFVNGENLSGVRQTRWNPLVRPSRAADGRWTVDAWAPLEGRVVNGGVRLSF